MECEMQNRQTFEQKAEVMRQRQAERKQPRKQVRQRVRGTRRRHALNDPVRREGRRLSLEFRAVVDRGFIVCRGRDYLELKFRWLTYFPRVPIIAVIRARKFAEVCVELETAGRQFTE